VQQALCLYVFPLSLALHAGMACLFFSSLPAEAARPTADGVSTGASDGVSIGASDGVSTGTSDGVPTNGTCLCADPGVD